MTNIVFYKADDIIAGFTAKGHAGYAPEGEDIVCAGISVLVINFINSVEELTIDEFKVNENDGEIEFFFEEEPSKESQLLVKSLEIGLRDLEKENSDFISLDYKEV